MQEHFARNNENAAFLQNLSRDLVLLFGCQCLQSKEFTRQNDFQGDLLGLRAQFIGLNQTRLEKINIVGRTAFGKERGRSPIGREMCHAFHRKNIGSYGLSQLFNRVVHFVLNCEKNFCMHSSTETQPAWDKSHSQNKKAAASSMAAAQGVHSPVARFVLLRRQTLLTNRRAVPYLKSSPSTPFVSP